MSTTTDRPVHRPGVISAFFVYKAGLFAAGFWAWLVHLAAFGVPVSGWYLVATTGAVTCTLIGVVLGTRMALQHNAAVRHQEIMKTLVEISWDTFAPPTTDEPRTLAGTNGYPETRNPETRNTDTRNTETRGQGESRDGDAGVIHLTPDLRQRPRR